MAYSFWKMFFIGQNFKLVRVTFVSWTFDLHLINFRYLVFGVYFSSLQRKILCEYKLHEKPIMKYWYWCWKNLFYNVKLKLFINQFQFFMIMIMISFMIMDTFSEAAVCRCSLKQMLLKILQYSELKTVSNAGVFL